MTAVTVATERLTSRHLMQFIPATTIIIIIIIIIVIIIGHVSAQPPDRNKSRVKSGRVCECLKGGGEALTDAALAQAR